MITENQVLLMTLDIFLNTKNKMLMDILMVRTSMTDIEIWFKSFLMDIFMVKLSMMNNKWDKSL